MAKSNWTANDIPNQQGKVVVITGATSGLGKEAARVFASKNATVIMAIRNLEKGKKAINQIKKTQPNADILTLQLDLSNLASVKDFSDKFDKKYQRLDVLINNAGVMMCPYSKTKDGLEIQMGVNHFGHFALVGHLMPLLKKTKNSRIVSTSSIAHRGGNIDFSDINWENRSYKTTQAYSDSKIANLYFMNELARRYQNDADAPIITAAHPGWTKTELQRHSGFAQFLNNFFAQGVAVGTLPTLRAAIDTDAKSGDYYGPSRFFEMHGNPVKVGSTSRARNGEAAKKLWAISEEVTGVSY